MEDDESSEEVGEKEGSEPDLESIIERKVKERTRKLEEKIERLENQEKPDTDENEADAEEEFSRRRFLKFAGLSAGSLALSSTAASWYSVGGGGGSSDTPALSDVLSQGNDINGNNLTDNGTTVWNSSSQTINPSTVNGDITTRSGGVTQIDANTYKGSSQPSNPLQGDQWIDTNNQQYKIYNGSNWEVINDIAAIPDSGDLHARYDATKISASDGDSVSTWTDETGNGHDLSAGTAPTYKTSIINGNPVVRFDGADDYLEVVFNDLSQPNQIFAVMQYQSTSTSAAESAYGGADDNGARHVIQSGSSSGNWRIYGGTLLSSSTAVDTTAHITNAFFNSTSSKLRLDGSQIASGDVGSYQLSGFQVGSEYNETKYANVDIGEILIYPQDKTGIESDVESYLSDKWGISI